jgi:hypothetical protein
MRLIRTGCALLLLLVCAASPGRAQNGAERVAFRDFGFSIAIPAGWQPIPDSVIRGRAATTPPAPGVRDVAGFRAMTAPDWFDPPYLMVKVQDTGPVEAAELERLALDPARRIALLQWLNLLEEAYGVEYDPALFAWNDSDRIMWVAASGSSDPFPDVISLAGAVVYPRGVVLMAYRVFPSMDLARARDLVRTVLLSVRIEQ